LPNVKPFRHRYGVGTGDYLSAKIEKKVRFGAVFDEKQSIFLQKERSVRPKRWA
jgi:hypothetical protein